MERTKPLKRGVPSRIFSTGHRTIARQYFFLSLAAVLAGTALSLLMRFHLIYPDAQIAGSKSQDALNTVAKLREPGVNDPRIDLAEARAAAALSDFRRALDANSRAAEQASKLGSSLERAQALQQQCWANRNLGHLDEALDAGTKAQAIFEQSHNARGEARSARRSRARADALGRRVVGVRAVRRRRDLGPVVRLRRPRLR